MKHAHKTFIAIASSVVGTLGIGLLVGFLGDWIPSASIRGPAQVSMEPAWLVNLCLVAGFGVQHSVMARESFKDWLYPDALKPIERSIYVLLTGVTLFGIVALWQPMTDLVWQLQHPIAIGLTTMGSIFGWGLATLAMVAIDALQLLGLRQAGVARAIPDTFRQGWLHSRVRHPIYTGLLIAFWSTPEMSDGHLLFAMSMTIYIRVGIYFEERHLTRVHGDVYRRYIQTVPMLIPRLSNAETNNSPRR